MILKRLIICCLVTTFVIQAMIPEKSIQSEVENLPVEIKVQIINALTNSKSLEAAADNIRSLATINKKFYAIINDEQVTKQLINLLAARMIPQNRAYAAALLRTKGAIEWLIKNVNTADIGNILILNYSVPRPLVTLPNEFLYKIINAGFELSVPVLYKIVFFSFSADMNIINTLIARKKVASENMLQAMAQYVHFLIFAVHQQYQGLPSGVLFHDVKKAMALVNATLKQLLPNLTLSKESFENLNRSLKNLDHLCDQINAFDQGICSNFGFARFIESIKKILNKK